MGSLRLGRGALGAYGTAILLASCGGLQATSPPTGTYLAQTSASGPSLSHGSAAVRAKGADLIYVGYGLACGTFCSMPIVDVYASPDGRFVGSWTGVKDSGIGGECADGAGNVFVTYSDARNGGSKGEILKFAHGGTSVVATLKVGNAIPQACSVDPNTGDLAVVSVVNLSETGTLSIFRKAAGHPENYSDPGVIFYGVGYDDVGNIFADGVSDFSFAFAELPKGVGEVQWDGQHVTLGFGINRDGGDGLQIDRLDVTGSVAQVVGVTRLKRASHDAISQYAFAGNKIVVAWHFQPRGCPVSGCGAEPGGVGTWSYPAGSTIVKRVTHGRDHVAEPIGVALSYAQGR
jgi:hypothetical protein